MNRVFARTLLFALGACSVFTPMSAIAQQAKDVVVMRRWIAEANPVGHWQLGDTIVQPGCSPNSPATTPLRCVSDTGADVDLSLCTGTRPVGATTGADYSTCTFDWVPGTWSGWSSTCSGTATRTRTVTCTRKGGDSTPLGVADARCTGTKPGTSETTSVTSGCTLPEMDFEVASVRYWWSSANGGLTTDNPHGGIRSYKGSYSMSFAPPVSHLPHGRYRFSIWHRCETATRLKFGLMNGNGSYRNDTGFVTCDTTWRKSTFETYSPSANAGGFRIERDFYTYDDRIFQVDDMEMTFLGA